jgi:hypothetical protein
MSVEFTFNHHCNIIFSLSDKNCFMFIFYYVKYLKLVIGAFLFKLIRNNSHMQFPQNIFLIEFSLSFENIYFIADFVFIPI